MEVWLDYSATGPHCKAFGWSFILGRFPCPRWSMNDEINWIIFPLPVTSVRSILGLHLYPPSFHTIHDFNYWLPPACAFHCFDETNLSVMDIFPFGETGLLVLYWSCYHIDCIVFVAYRLCSSYVHMANKWGEQTQAWNPAGPRQLPSISRPGVCPCLVSTDFCRFIPICAFGLQGPVSDYRRLRIRVPSPPSKEIPSKEVPGCFPVGGTHKKGCTALHENISIRLNPIAPKSDQFQISPAVSPEILHDSMKNLAFHSELK